MKKPTEIKGEVPAANDAVGEKEKSFNGDIVVNTTQQQEQLLTFIKENNRSAILSLTFALLLIILGIALVAFSCDCRNSGANAIFNGTLTLYVGNTGSKLFVALLVETAGIGLIMAYRSSLKQAGDYRTELIALRDLNIALEICNKTTVGDFETTIVNDGNKTITRHKSQKSKVQQAVIEALLNRYN